MLTVNLTADYLLTAFYGVLQEAIEKFVPVKRNLHCTKQPKHIVWYPPNIRRATARKRCLWRHHKANPNDEAIAAAYKLAESKSKQLIHLFELDKEQKVINSGNIGTFYKFVNTKLSSRNGV